MPANGEVGQALITLPALYLTVWSGTSESSKGSPLNNANVTISDQNCPGSGQQVKRSYPTESSGHLKEVERGLPVEHVHDLRRQRFPT